MLSFVLFWFNSTTTTRRWCSPRAWLEVNWHTKWYDKRKKKFQLNFCDTDDEEWINQFEFRWIFAYTHDNSHHKKVRWWFECMTAAYTQKKNEKKNVDKYQLHKLNQWQREENHTSRWDCMTCEIGMAL